MKTYLCAVAVTRMVEIQADTPELACRLAEQYYEPPAREDVALVLAQQGCTPRVLGVHLLPDDDDGPGEVA